MKLILAPKHIEGINDISSNCEIKNQAKNTFKNHKNKKILQLKIGDDLTLKHDYIDGNQEFIRCRNQPNILPLFRRLGRSLISLLSSL
jgi:hypothetical protein